MKKMFFHRLAIIFTAITISIQIYSNSNNEKYFVIVIPSYNNARWYEKNLRSVLAQNYEKFHALYTDDCSNDNTAALVEEYLQRYDINNKVTLIKNNERHGALYNLYHMINMCDDDTIIVTLDGDDWLPDENVLKRLNDIYFSDDIWLTYGQFQLHPSGNRGWASAMPDYIVDNNAFRDFQHLPTHLRTFYSWLFKQIKLEDLLYMGHFFPMTWDMTMMFPMIEMAGERHRFIPDIMYIYNEENNISDHHVSRQLQAHLAQVMKKKPRYTRLQQKPLNQPICQKAADVIIFSQTPQKLEQLLESFARYVTDTASISVMYEVCSATEKNEYDALLQKYPDVKFHLIDAHRTNFKQVLLDLYTTAQSDYILFSKGDACWQKPLSLSEYIEHLEKTAAYAFYFKLNAHDAMHHYPHLPLVECKDGIFAWNFSLAQNKWSSSNSLDLVLHKKRDSLFSALHGYYDLTPNGLELAWGNEGNLDRLGLCLAGSITATTL